MVHPFAVNSFELRLYY